MRCNTTSISEFALKQRWRLFGHILRKTPAREATTGYFCLLEAKKYKSHKGASEVTLPVLLQHDIHFVGLTLNTTMQLKQFQNIAKNRDQWTSLVHKITSADRSSSKLQKKRKQHDNNPQQQDIIECAEELAAEGLQSHHHKRSKINPSFCNPRKCILCCCTFMPR